MPLNHLYHILYTSCLYRITFVQKYEVVLGWCWAQWAGQFRLDLGDMEHHIWIFRANGSLSLTAAGFTSFSMGYGPMKQGWSFREVPWRGMSCADSQTLWPGTYRGAMARRRFAKCWFLALVRCMAARVSCHTCQD